MEKKYITERKWNKMADKIEEELREEVREDGSSVFTPDNFDEYMKRIINMPDYRIIGVGYQLGKLRRRLCRKRNIRDLHPGQIPTEPIIIKDELSFKGAKAIDSLIKCLTSDPGSTQQKNHLVIAAALFERVSCLVYKSKRGVFRKPSAETYKKEIFESWAETPEEVLSHTEKYGADSVKAEHIHKLLWRIADLVCPMMACLSEQAFVSEYARAIEYVIERDGDLPKPVISELFPTNYPEYDPSGGIAEVINGYRIL